VEQDAISVFCLGAAFRHKNLLSIPRVAARLRRLRPDRRYRFVLTLPDDSAIWRELADLGECLGVGHAIENAGPLRVSDCVEWYRRADVVFLPTVLEVFSATYLEAMAMGKPIVTSDLDFARSTCGEAAHYYDAASPDAAAEAIDHVVHDDEFRRRLIAAGRARLSTFPHPDAKHRMVLTWLGEIARALP
jgi:glycosyltransferase involved in cell wall biosynthesis